MTHLHGRCPPPSVCCPGPHPPGPSRCAVWSCPRHRTRAHRRRRCRTAAAAVEQPTRRRSRRCYGCHCPRTPAAAGTATWIARKRGPGTRCTGTRSCRAALAAPIGRPLPPSA